MIVGLLHPGEMGAAVGAVLTASGHEVLWAAEGRSAQSAHRAEAAGLRGLPSTADVVAAAEMVLSVCPPHAAVEVARSVASKVARGSVAGSDHGSLRYYVDANAVSPSTSAEIEAAVTAAGLIYVDGGIIGPPPSSPGTTRLYLSGEEALTASETLGSPILEVHVLSTRAGDASALKCSYAAWTKGSAALLLAAREAARRSGVDDALVTEWRTSVPDLIDRFEGARRSAEAKGWRWAGEMEEIARMFEESGLPSGFHLAAADMFRRQEGR